MCHTYDIKFIWSSELANYEKNMTHTACRYRPPVHVIAQFHTMGKKLSTVSYSLDVAHLATLDIIIASDWASDTRQSLKQTDAKTLKR